MTRYFILPYRQGSRSARALAHALGGRVLRLQGSTYKPRTGDVVVNWGNTAAEPPKGCTVVQNPPDTIVRASNKKLFFQLMQEKGHGEIIPRFWTDRTAIPDDAFPIVCRTVLAGHSGDGIVIAAGRDGVVAAPLYVQYVKKQDEYRIHVGRDGSSITTISVQRKARSNDVPDDKVNWQVRNHANGFVFVRQGVSPPNSVIEAAATALEASGLDFGAVDVIYNQEKKRAYVLEINTAPGLEGQTVEDYAAYFRSA